MRAEAVEVKPDGRLGPPPGQRQQVPHAPPKQDGDQETHKLIVTGLPAAIERPKTSAIVIDWSASLSSGTLRGRRPSKRAGQSGFSPAA